MTKFPVPIRLFLDKTSLLLTGDGALLRWWVVNEGQQTIRQVQIELRPSVMTSDTEVLPAAARQGIALMPNGDMSITSSLTIGRSGPRAFDVRVSGMIGNGHPLEAASTHEVVLTFVKPEAGAVTTIEIGGSGLVKNVRSVGSLHIKAEGEALVKDINVGSGSSVEVQSGAALPKLDDLLEVRLHTPEPEGLYPLDVPTLVAKWPWPSSLKLRFIDRKDHPITEGHVDRGDDVWCVNDIYRARLEFASSGFLTLLGSDSSGAYFLAAPSTSDGGERLAAGVWRFPDDIAPTVPELRFQHVGEERLLAVLTPEPLLEPSLEIVTPLPLEHVASLLTTARTMAGSMVALTSVSVLP